MLFARVAAIGLAIARGRPHFAAAQAPVSGGPVDAALIEDLVAANRILADQGCSMPMAMSGPPSTNPNRYLISRAMSPANATATAHHEFGLDSNPVDQARPQHVPRALHPGEIYKARPDVNAVIHSHRRPCPVRHHHMCDTASVPHRHHFSMSRSVLRDPRWRAGRPTCW